MDAFFQSLEYQQNVQNEPINQIHDFITDPIFQNIHSHQNDDMIKRKSDEPEKKPRSKKRKVKESNEPQKPKRNTGLNKPLILSAVLSDLLDGAQQISRPELVKQLWKYIKEHNLQDPSDRRFILCDEKLKKIFEQDRINSFGMNRDLSAHLTNM